MTPVDWRTIQRYSPKEYFYPDRLDDSIVRAMDRLAGLLKVKPRIIDDFRFTSDNKNSQHLKGLAVDFVVPSLDSLTVLNTLKASKMFSGIGIYTNENNAVSFHVDTRTDRSVENPAIWGATKDRTQGITDWIYTTMDSVVELIKEKKTPIFLLGIGALIVVMYLILKK